MGNDFLITVVVPAYNVGNYLDLCLQSIVSQTYRNLDIVVVDDGSSDETPALCDCWVKKDSRIKVIHQVNSGVTVARKMGVKKALGDWVTFVDADDILPPHAIETLVKNIDGTDLVVGQVAFNGPYRWPYPKIDALLCRKKYLSFLFRNKIHSGPVAKLFKKNAFQEVVFAISRNITCGEDFLMNIRAAKYVSLVRVIKDVVYAYEYREGSAMTQNPFVSLIYSTAFVKSTISSLKKEMSSIPLTVFYCIDVYMGRFKKKIRLMLKK